MIFKNSNKYKSERSSSIMRPKNENKYGNERNKEMNNNYNFRDVFQPYAEYSHEENKEICSPYYIEVGRECYQYPGLKNKKNDILVYSAILAGLNNDKSDTFSYVNNYLASRLDMDKRVVRRAIKNLEELGLIKITHPSGNKRNIKVIKDLRYPLDGTKKRGKNKSVIKVYDRIFFYPMITKAMVHIYSYYLALTSIPNYPGYSTVSYKKVADSLGYSSKHVIDTLHDMEKIGLVKIVHSKTKKNVKGVRLEVDFSKKQPEEIAYEKEREEFWKKYHNKESPMSKLKHEIRVLEIQKKDLDAKADNGNDIALCASIRIEGELNELREQLKIMQSSAETEDCNANDVPEITDDQQQIESATDSSQKKPIISKSARKYPPEFWEGW